MSTLSMPTLLVTGGCGFIGSNFILKARRLNWGKIINLDVLTYAANLSNLESLTQDPNYIFIKGSIGDRQLVKDILAKYQPNAIINFAAESHVDRSILNPEAFIETNIVGTQRLLEESLDYWNQLEANEKQAFRFLHVSTDEVYGSLKPTDKPFEETTPYDPRSPYSASKAASDHLVSAYHHTYGLPTLVTNCSNNYGPYQFPEKLIPLVILNALSKKTLPIYGDGQNIRDWLYVEDHCQAIYTVLLNGHLGETYNVGGETELTNLTVVETICDLLDELTPQSNFSHRSLITFVKDRLGHDRRYAVNCNKIKQELGWSPEQSFLTGIRSTVEWYLNNRTWVDSVCSGEYRHWLEQNYQKQ